MGVCSQDFLSLSVRLSQRAPQASAHDPDMLVFLTLRMEKAHLTDEETEEGYYLQGERMLSTSMGFLSVVQRASCSGKSKQHRPH